MKSPLRCIINDREVETLLPTGTAVLDFIRQHQKLTGTKEGCKEGECGACTVLLGRLIDNHIQYKAVASCLLPLGELEGKHVVTVEGINLPGSQLTPVQQALVDEGASQCGFCTPGIVMSLTGFFFSGETLNYQEAIDALDGNICRCTGYVSIQRAVQNLCTAFSSRLNTLHSITRLREMIKLSFLPEYFLEIPARLQKLKDREISSASTETSPPDFTGKKTVVAGGTDLYIQKPDELYQQDLELLSTHEDISGFLRKDSWLYIGAGSTVEELKLNPEIKKIFPNLKEHLNLVSSTIMRNRATLAGNIVNASPIGDLTIILLAMDADISLIKGKQTRLLPLKAFFKGYKKLDLKKGEIIKTIEIPIPFPGTDFRFNFEKVSRRRYLDIASCNSAISIKMEEDVIYDIHISAGGVAPIPLYLENTCVQLRGKPVNAANILDAVEVMGQEIAPIDDVRGSAKYKTLLLRNLIFAHFITLFPEKKLDEELL